MSAIEFNAELSGSGVLLIPSEAAAQLPKAGRVRVIILTDADSSEGEWNCDAYQQFLRDDSPEDDIYEPLR
jgi:hypothetical protein